MRSSLGLASQADHSNFLVGKCWLLRCVDVLYSGVQVESDRLPTQMVTMGKTAGRVYPWVTLPRAWDQVLKG